MKVFITATALLLSTLTANAQSCRQCMHGCNGRDAEACRSLWDKSASLPDYPITKPLDGAEARIDASDKHNCRLSESHYARDTCFYLLGREHGRLGR